MQNYQNGYVLFIAQPKLNVLQKTKLYVDVSNHKMQQKNTLLNRIYGIFLLISKLLFRKRTASPFLPVFRSTRKSTTTAVEEVNTTPAGQESEEEDQVRENTLLSRNEI